MRSLRVRRRPRVADDGPSGGPVATWNTVSTLGAGSVAAIDARGAIFPYGRPVSIECWFGVGDRWLRGEAGDGVRQRRVDGLPVIETRQRAGEDDLVLTAWADESGDARGRVVVELSNETPDAVVVAVVVRPHSLGSDGSIKKIRSVDTLLVADRSPLVDLGREPGDVVSATDPDRDIPAVLDALGLDRSALQGDRELADGSGAASMAALLPLTPGIDRRIEIFDGVEQPSVSAAPMDNILNGWKAHLGGAAEFELPRWPDHLPPALITGVVAAVPDRAGPPGDSRWTGGDDALLATALAGVGVSWGAAEILDRLLDDVISGRLDRQDWVGVACAVSAGAFAKEVVEVLEHHGEALAVVVGEALSTISNERLAAGLVAALESVHGSDAATDARSITVRPKDDATALALRHGFLARTNPRLPPGPLEELDADGPAMGIAASMISALASEDAYEPVVPIRAAAGSTWRWSRGTCGDSPHARAALLVAMRAVCVGESSTVVDLFPGADASWLGQSAAFRRVPTQHGRLSCAVRWHGARAALLWEFEDAVNEDVVVTASVLDPTFRGSGASGEVLLAEPTHLVEAT